MLFRGMKCLIFQRCRNAVSHERSAPSVKEKENKNAEICNESQNSRLKISDLFLVVFSVILIIVSFFSTVQRNWPKISSVGYAVASTDLEPGDLITTELPFTYGPKSDSAPICLGCHCGVDGKTMCSFCGWPVCNEMCEKLPIHSENECIIFSKAKIKFTPVRDFTTSCPQYECITPLRVLLTKEREEENWEREVKRLESHCEIRKKTETWRIESVNVVGFLHKVCKLQERFSDELIHFVCGILEVNSFIAPVAYGFEIRCLYPKASLFAHSCVPNVGHYIFCKSDDRVNFRIYVRAMIKIKKGQELFLTYTQTLSPTYFRRAHLREGKFFDCTCQRCADPTELETNLSTLKCAKCEHGWAVSTNPLDESAVWRCSSCKVANEADKVLQMLNCIKEEADKLHFVKNIDPVTCREDFINKYCSILHPNHAIIMSLKSSLSQLYGKVEGYLLKDLSYHFLERKIELCNQINDISNKIKPGISRQRGWNLYELYAPVILQAKNQFRRKEIDERGLKTKFEMAAKYLEEVALIFSYEDPESPEGVTGKKVFQILKNLKAIIEAESE